MATFFKTVALPALCLIIALVAVVAAPASFLQSLHVPLWAPVALVLITSVLGHRFGQSNAVLALIILLLSYLALTAASPPLSDDASTDVLFAGISILLPANLLIFAMFEERGLLNPWGLLRLILILAQATGLYWIASSGDPGTQKAAMTLFQYRFFPTEIRVWSQLPDFSILLHAVGILILSLQLGITRSAPSAGFLGALVAGCLAVGNVSDPAQVQIFLITGMAILGVSILQSVYQMAFIDELTGIPGRRALMLEMKKLGANYVIAMCDIDHFKHFNDTYGHDTGDQVLKMVATQLNRVGGGGKVFRYGGEEFCILMPGKNIRAAKPHLEEIRAAVAQSAFHIRAKDRPKKKPKGKTRKSNGRKVFVTISIGLSNNRKNAQTATETLRQADAALYRAKKAGRDRVST